MIAANRIAPLIDPPAKPRPRTAAQRAASRRNGAHSRGPRTARGRAVSRLNATKHGLTALIAPPADSRNQNALFRQIRQDLMDEFRPGAFTDRMLIDALAADMLQMARSRQMIEQAQRPMALSPQEDERWHRLQERRRDLRLMEKVLARLDGPTLEFTRKQADRLTKMLAEVLDQIEVDLAEEAEEAAAGLLDNEDKEQMRPARELMAALGPARQRLRDRQHVAALLRGEKRLSSGDRKGLRSLLKYLADAARQSVGGQGDLERQVAKLEEMAVYSNAESPKTLMLLQRYLRQIERSIERKMRQLRRDQ